MFIFYKELTLTEGFAVLANHRANRVIEGIKISAPSGVALWNHYHQLGELISCWKCGVTADRFILRHHPNDCKKPPILELFAHTGKSHVLMTRDHIIPSSLGGVNSVDNLRPGCEPCNRKRQNTMDHADTEFMRQNTHLYVHKK